MNKNFCYAPFVHMYLHDKHDKKLCCLSNDSHDTSIETIPNNFKEYWSSSFYQSVRKKMLNNEYVENCTHCYKQEANGEFSERDRYTMMFGDKNIQPDIIYGNQYKTPIDLELRPGNLCNLKCRMCSPNASSQIEKEVNNNKDMLLPIYTHHNDMITDAFLNLSEENIEYLLSNAEHINQIKLLGGEPTIMPETIAILELLLEKKLLNMTIHVTTNCTNANERFLELIKNFNVCYNFSIDGSGKTLEYIRYPINFNKLEENMQILCQGVQDSNAQILYTLQAYSLPNLVDFLTWVIKMHDLLQENNNTPDDLELIVSDLVGPEWASIQSLPLDKRNEWIDNALHSKIINRFSSNIDEVIASNFRLIKSNITEVLTRLRNDTTEHSIDGFVDVTKRFDTVRKQHIKDFIPELWEIIHIYYKQNG